MFESYMSRSNCCPDCFSWSLGEKGPQLGCWTMCNPDIWIYRTGQDWPEPFGCCVINPAEPDGCQMQDDLAPTGWARRMAPNLQLQVEKLGTNRP